MAGTAVTGRRANQDFWLWKPESVSESWQELDRLSWELEWDLARLGNSSKACTWVLLSQLLREDRVTVT